mmetsp:Transcript_104592/g.196943  ORF Transcript_104592/g.196943 Transcript_104592/m.196943 type:complete len:214 (-) Transcript_104592:91-732(-)
MVWMPDHLWRAQKKGKGKGGGGWGGAGSWAGPSPMDAMMNQMMMMPMMMAAAKGGGGGGRWGVKKWQNKKKGQENRPKFSELSEERQAEIIEKQTEKAAKEGRKTVGNVLHEGTIVKYYRNEYGWIKPSNLFKLPKAVKDKMQEMTAENKAKAEEHKRDDTWDEEMLYFRKADVVGFPMIKLTRDMEVKFKVYVDEKGAGACDIVPPSEAILT